MIKYKCEINEIKDKIASLFGREVVVRVNMGRNKFATCRGKISGVYPALFTVKPDGEFLGKTSYSYSEMICGSVRLKES